MPNKTITKEKGESITVDLIDWEATAKAQEESKKKAEEKKKKADEKKKKAEEKKANEKKKKEEAKQKKKDDEEAKKPKFFDRGFWGGVGLAIGAAIGFATGLAIAAIPFLISAVAAGIYKAVSYGVQSARYRAAQNEQRAKNLKAEADAKKTDTPEKEETKDKTADKAIEKTQAQKELDLVKQNKKGLSADQNALLNQVVTARHAINDMLQGHASKDFDKDREVFLEELAQVCVLKDVELAIQNGKQFPSDQLDQGIVEASAEEFAKTKVFQRMADTIQTPQDMERFQKLAAENKGAGLMEEMRKCNLKEKDAQEIKEKAMEKTAGKEKEQEQKQMTQTAPQAMQ